LTFGAFALPVGVAFRLELGPLIGGEDAAQAEEHPRIRLFEVGAQVGDVRNLREGALLIERAGIQDGLQLDLLFFESGVHLDELETAVEEDLVELLLLVGCDVEVFDNFRLLPPHAMGEDAHALAASAFRASAHLAAGRKARLAGHSGVLGQGKWGGKHEGASER
jgi:hypothetical protein